jgi:2-keto-3-deoxy-L-rhamnonate aldolase RhmA
MVVIIVEEKRAVEKIDEIAAVPGIDVIFIGVNDLSFSYGQRGRYREVPRRRIQFLPGVQRCADCSHR